MDRIIKGLMRRSGIIKWVAIFSLAIGAVGYLQHRGVDEYAVLQSIDLKFWSAEVTLVFLLLYAAYGIWEVDHRLPAAWAFIRRQWKRRHYLEALLLGPLRILVACGPFYIAIEAVRVVLGGSGAI